MKSYPTEIKSSYYLKTGQALDKLSRYNIYKRLVDDEKNVYIESPNKMTIKQSKDDSFYQVEKGYENRMDLISYKFYGTPLLWWAIARANKIQDPMDVPSGIVLRIPSMRNIYDSGSLNRNA